MHAKMIELEDLIDGPMKVVDETERAAARIGVGAETDKGLVLARRYEAACERKFKWVSDQLKAMRKPAVKALRIGIIEPKAVPRPDPMEEPQGDVVDLATVFPVGDPPAEAEAEAESPSPSRGPFAGFVSAPEARDGRWPTARRAAPRRPGPDATAERRGIP